MRVVSLNEYADMPRKHVDWLVTNVIPRPGIVMLVGPEKAGKSFLALDIGLKVSRGEHVLGYPCHEPRRVLYLQFDTSEAIWRDRIVKLRASGVDVSSDRLVMVHPEDQMLPFNIMSPLGQEWLSKVLDICDPELVIVDVMREIHNRDENDSTAMKDVGDAITRAFNNRSLLLVHHTKKIPYDYTSDSNPGTLVRGSSYITGKVDSYWLLFDGKLRLVNRFESGRTLRCMQTENGMWTFPELCNDEILIPQIQELCRLNPQTSHHEIAKAAVETLHISRATYYRLLSGHCAHSQKSNPASGINDKHYKHYTD